MKLPDFQYFRPQSVTETLDLLAAFHEDAQLLAGGQSLLPMMAFRLAAPARLIDISRLPELNSLDIGLEGTRLGAAVRWAQIERNSRLQVAQPLLVEAIRHIAHHQIRQKGTIGGSLALADPAAELPVVAVCCDAEVEIVGQQGHRRVPAEAFLLGAMTTALEPDEMIAALHLPAWRSNRRHAFEEFALRRGDYALAGVAILLDCDNDGAVTKVRIVALGMAEAPQRLREAEAGILGRRLSPEAVTAAAAAAEAEVDPPEDLVADLEYRRALLGHLVATALRRCA